MGTRTGPTQGGGESGDITSNGLSTLPVTQSVHDLAVFNLVLYTHTHAYELILKS